MSDVILLGHAPLEFWGRWRRLWVFVEALNAREENARRIRAGVGGCGDLYVCGVRSRRILVPYFYPAEKAIILKGPWTFAHNVFMETKEHLFFTI